MVDLGLTEEQAALVDSFGALLSKSSSPERVRAAEPEGFDPDLWRTLNDTGVVVMALPEADGGWGAQLLDLALVAEQLGRSMAAAPVIEAQVAARLLARSGGAPEAVAAVVEGRSLTTLAVHPARGGVCDLVPGGAVCDHLVALVDDELRLVALDADCRAPVANLGGAPLADVRVVGGQVLARGASARALFEAALDEWLVLTAAAVVAMAEVALELACTYAVERHAFGAAIGSFQGVAHPLADDATAIDGARLLVRKAAWTLQHRGARSRELAAMAFAFASESAAATTYDAVHVHGGYGFMLEYDVQLLYRRARGWPRVWGDVSRANDRVAQARYGDRQAGAADGGA